MAQTFKKSITKLDTVTSYDGKTDVVYNVGWYYIIEDDSNDTQDQLLYETELSIDSISSFTDYSALTEVDVIAWIEEMTWHNGRDEIPRTVDDELKMRSDGVPQDWF